MAANKEEKKRTELVLKERNKIIAICPVCRNDRLTFYNDLIMSNIDVVCPVCKRFLMVINEFQDSKNIHLHIYKTQTIVNGIIRAHYSEFEDW